MIWRGEEEGEVYFYGQRGGRGTRAETERGRRELAACVFFFLCRAAACEGKSLDVTPTSARGCKGRCNELVGADVVVGFLGLFPAFFLLPFTSCDDGS